MGKPTVAADLPDDILCDDDIYIAVMGLTGSGKSELIKLCTRQQVPVGHDLESCTQSVAVYTFNHNGRRVHMVDTPGFDDTLRSDSEVFREIVYWLSKSQEHHFLLNGIIYLHSIAQPRWSGSAERFLTILKAICGPENYGAVILSTTFWGTVDNTIAAERQRDLTSNLVGWKEMKAGGSIVYPHSAAITSANAMIDHIVRKNKKCYLRIQQELSLPNAKIENTTAGMISNVMWHSDIDGFHQKLDEVRKEWEGSTETSRSKLDSTIEEIYSMVAEREAGIASLSQARESFHKNWELLRRRRLAQVSSHNLAVSKAKQRQSPVQQQKLGFDALGHTSYCHHPNSIGQNGSNDLMDKKMMKIAQRESWVNAISAAAGVTSAVVAIVTAVGGGAALACNVM